MSVEKLLTKCAARGGVVQKARLLVHMDVLTRDFYCQHALYSSLLRSDWLPSICSVFLLADFWVAFAAHVCVMWTTERFSFSRMCLLDNVVARSRRDYGNVSEDVFSDTSLYPEDVFEEVLLKECREEGGVDSKTKSHICWNSAGKTGGNLLIKYRMVFIGMATVLTLSYDAFVQ